MAVDRPLRRVRVVLHRSAGVAGPHHLGVGLGIRERYHQHQVHRGAVLGVHDRAWCCVHAAAYPEPDWQCAADVSHIAGCMCTHVQVTTVGYGEIKPTSETDMMYAACL